MSLPTKQRRPPFVVEFEDGSSDYGTDLAAGTAPRDKTLDRQVLRDSGWAEAFVEPQIDRRDCCSGDFDEILVLHV